VNAPFPPGRLRDAPLTEAQAGLWYAQALDPENPVFNTGQFLDLRGPLDVAAFAAAVNGMVAEADALALRIVPGDPAPLQSVDEACRPWLEILDHRAAPNPEAAARAAMEADMCRLAPLAAQQLHILGPARHVWFQRVHHLAVDAFGTDLLVRRVAALYAAALGGPAAGPPLAPLSVAQAEDTAYRAAPRRAADAAFWPGRHPP
jgi:enterobactin synthetase component F